MKTTGIVRKIDELGRIVLPVELRRSFDLSEKDAVEITTDGDSIVLRKYQPSCLFCESTKSLVEHRGKRVCTKCVSLLLEKVER